MSAESKGSPQLLDEPVGSQKVRKMSYERATDEIPPECFGGNFDSSAESSETEYLDQESEIETIPRPESQIANLLYRPQLDSRSRELGTLNSLLVFVQRAPGNGWLMYELYPSITPHVFANSVGNDGLRHSILSMAAIIRDMFRARDLSTLYLDQKAKCLQSLQTALSNPNDFVDESVIIAVLGQVFTDLCMNDLGAIRRHLSGIYSIYKHLQKHGKLTPTARLIGRIASRVDITSAQYSGTDLIWPAFTPLDEIEDRKWMKAQNTIAKYMRSKDIEWALAGFELDHLWHQTYKFARQSDILRATDPNAESKIYIQFEILEQSFQLWKRRSSVIEQERIEKYFLTNATPLADPDPFNKFLGYEYLPIQDPFYAKLLNQWRAVYIYAALVPAFFIREVLTGHAVDICRTTAALGYEAFSGPQWECLFYAGMVLGDVEREWIVDRCRIIALLLPVLSPQVERLEQVWREGKGDWNAFGRLYPRKGEAWFN